MENPRRFCRVLERECANANSSRCDSINEDDESGDKNGDENSDESGDESGDEVHEVVNPLYILGTKYL